MPPASAAFQFHKGTIRTQFADFKVNNDAQFQFHKGTIRTDSEVKANQLNLYFNSIKVRLELFGKQNAKT